MIIHLEEKKDDVEYNNLEENDEADIECYDLIWERIVFYNNDNWRGYTPLTSDDIDKDEIDYDLIKDMLCLSDEMHYPLMGEIIVNWDSNDDTLNYFCTIFQFYDIESFMKGFYGVDTLNAIIKQFDLSDRGMSFRNKLRRFILVLFLKQCRLEMNQEQILD